MGRSAEARQRRLERARSRRRCTKIHYKTQKDANMAILSFWKRRMGEAQRYPKRSYWCEEHTCWHITSMSEKRYETQNAPGRDRT